ncbi:MAG: pre-peptidase C-terminal domain-containing protein [Desmonostoc vinosum HA7617-LM4]|nr:pre-peptidase C-terminal domain-containing protein [Desmonostoc vinosum HA7617-LM4]
MVRKINKTSFFRFNLALIFSLSSSLLIASYLLPIFALGIPSREFQIAKTPDERQPEAVQQGIEQIPVSVPSQPPQPKQPIDSPIPVRVPPTSTPQPTEGSSTSTPQPSPVDASPTPQPTEGGSTTTPQPQPSRPRNSSPTPQPRPRNTNPIPQPSRPRNSNPTPQPRPRNTNPIPQPSRPRNSNPTPQPTEGGSTRPIQRGRQPITPATQSSPISARSLPFREINFVDIAFGILSRGDFLSQGRYFHFYQFEGRENQLLQIRLGGSTDQRRSNNLSLNPFMFLLDPDNKVLLKRGSGGANSAIKDAFVFVRLPARGTYTIAVTSRNPKDTGRYSIALRNDRASYTLDELGELTAQSSILRQNGSPYNVSQFQGKKNQLVSIRVDSINEEFSPYIVLLNSKGQRIAADIDKDGKYSALIDRAKLPEDDTYYIIVTSNNPQERGTYRLTIF